MLREFINVRVRCIMPPESIDRQVMTSRLRVLLRHERHHQRLIPSCSDDVPADKRGAGMGRTAPAFGV